MLSAVPSSGTVNSVIRITGIGDRNRPEWLIRISGMRTMLAALMSLTSGKTATLAEAAAELTRRRHKALAGSGL